MEESVQVTNHLWKHLVYSEIPSDMGSVFTQENICNIPEEQAKSLITQMCKQVYVCKGRNVSNYTMEIENLVCRLYDKMANNYTVGDIKCFGEMLINGDISLVDNFICVTNILQAWKSYVGLRTSFLPEDDNKKKDIDHDEEYMPSDKAAERIQKIISHLHFSAGRWSRYVKYWEQLHGESYSSDKDDVVNGVNVGYERWLKAQDAEFDRKWEEKQEQVI